MLALTLPNFVAEFENWRYNLLEKNDTSNTNAKQGLNSLPSECKMWLFLLEVGSIFFGLTSTLCLMVALYLRANYH